MANVAKFILFLILLGYFFNSDYFERNFFVNELLSLIGLFCGIYYLGKKIKVKSLDFLVLLFLFLCAFHLLISIPKKTNWYFYARNSVIFYSVFSFYLGKMFFLYFDSAILKIKLILQGFVAYGLFIKNELLARYSGPVLYPLLLNKISNSSLLFLVVVIVLHGVFYEALSITFLAVMSFIFWFLKSYKQFKWFTVLTLFGLIITYVYFYDNIILYRTGKYAYFGNVLAVYGSHPLLNIDHNTSWRLILWYRYIVENFPSNLFGIGFGTPLLTYVPEVTTASQVIDEVHAHVSGAHNTFITLFTRLGLVGLFILVKICFKVFKAFYEIKQLNSHSRYLLYFLVWIVVFSLGLFNLCLESPIRSSLFWISLGFIARLLELKENGKIQILQA